MEDTSSSELTTNSDIVTQLANTDDQVRLSVAVLSSGVPSSADGESIQSLQAEYERAKVEMEEQRKRFLGRNWPS